MKDLLALINANIGIPNFLLLLGLAYYNYSKDKPNIKVLLRWDLPNYSEYGTGPVGEILATNSGRQQITITQLDLEVHVDGKIESLPFGKYGDTLREGDQLKTYRIIQGKLKKYSKDWKNIQAVVTDSSGKTYRSSIPSEGSIPSWASSEKK